MSQSAYWTTDATATNGHAAALGPVDRQAIVKRLELLGWLLDDAVGLPGTKLRIGWDGIIGLIPVVGDGMTTTLSLYFMWEAYRLGVSHWTLLKMLGNVGLDFLVGLVPVLGDLVDVGLKANRRNLALLRRALDEDMAK